MATPGLFLQCGEKNKAILGNTTWLMYARARWAPIWVMTLLYGAIRVTVPDTGDSKVIDVYR